VVYRLSSVSSLSHDLDNVTDHTQPAVIRVPGRLVRLTMAVTRPASRPSSQQAAPMLLQLAVLQESVPKEPLASRLVGSRIFGIVQRTKRMPSQNISRSSAAAGKASTTLTGVDFQMSQLKVWDSGSWTKAESLVWEEQVLLRLSSHPLLHF
jgi:hypothetical protein